MNNYLYIIVNQDIHDKEPIINTNYIEAENEIEACDKGFLYFSNLNNRITKTILAEKAIKI